MRYVPELLEKHGIKVHENSLHAFIFSYAKDADAPIIFAHYKHKHSVPHPIEYPLKSTGFCRLYFFMSGKFGFSFDNATYMPAYGDVIIVPERAESRSCFFSPTHVDYYELFFPLELFDKINTTNPFTKVFFGQYADKKDVLSLNGASRETVFNTLKKIDELAIEENFNDFLAYSYLIRIMDIIATSQDSVIDVPQTTILPPKLHAAIDYIHCNFATLEGVDEVALNLGITKTYLARLFKKFDFATPSEYINEVRIAHAKHLIDNGYSLSQACYNSGFANYSYFVTRFKKITGTTPSRFPTLNKEG